LKYILKISLFLSFFIGKTIFCQTNEQLAKKLFLDKDYLKAAIIYEDLVSEFSENPEYYENYLTCLIQTQNQGKAISFLRKKSKKNSFPLPFMIDECWIHASHKEGQKEFQKLSSTIISKVKSDYLLSLQAAKLFSKRNLKSEAIEILQNIEENFGESQEVSNEIALLYIENGQRFQALERYIEMMTRSNIRYDQLKQIFDTYITDSADIINLQQLLLVKIQQFPQVTALSEWLKWTFIQTQDWEKALIYSKSLDKRLRENGIRVFELGNICFSNKSYSVALLCFEYCLNKGEISHDLSSVKSNYLQTEFELLRLNYKDSVNWQNFNNKLIQYIREYGISNSSFKIAELSAFIYLQNLNRLDSAIMLLETYVEAEYLNKRTIANAKIALANTLLVGGDVWKSELLFAQVEKEFKDDILGQKAKFSRAELSFYRGNYEWANMQLDVLKDATTQLISNDAMELSLCITDNLGIDSNYLALDYYAKSTLFQKQLLFDSALFYLEKLATEFPGHSLGDELLFSKAKIAEKKGDVKRSIELYKIIIDAYSNDILADNAIYELAQIYQYKEKNIGLAIEMYKKIIENHSNSIYIVDARKEFRKLRGF
jgi:tetratricopeptide (TPR) repeat protein